MGKRDMTGLTVRLLGYPEIRCGEQLLTFRTRKVLALFIYLLMEQRMHSRESLTALLWPESDVLEAGVTLRATLSRLRRSLQSAGDVLITEAGKVGFQFDGTVNSDLDWLAAAALSIHASNDLAHIMEIDRGEFLSGFTLPDAPEFDRWAAVERQKCQLQVETIYARLTRSLISSGSGAKAVEAAVCWLARAPLNELAYRSLMAAQALSGNRAAALATYAKCQEQFRSELNIEPGKETVDLAHQIRQTEMPAPSIDVVVTQDLCLPFVGRAAEHSQLAAAFHQTIAAGARVCTVIGAGGVGKTRLIQAFLEWAVLDTPNVDILQGRAFEMGGRLPYEPVIEVLRQRLEKENAPEDLLDDVWLAELSQLMPELRARYPDLPPPLTGDASFVRSRLFAAIAALGSALAGCHPVVLVLDDMQWVDVNTRELILYAARRWAEGGAPVLLLLVIRQENFAADTALQEWLAQLNRDVPNSRLLLDMLNGAAVRQLVANLQSDRSVADTQSEDASISDAARDFGDWLWGETGGLPFFIEALLHMLLEKNVLTSQAKDGSYDFDGALKQVRGAGRVPLPPGVRDVIHSRLQRLRGEEAALLLAGAVLGRACTFSRLCQVAGLDEETGLTALEALLNSRLLVQSGTARRPYTLAHDYVRIAVYDACSDARRIIYHRRALFSLEGDGAPAVECAYHAAAALLDEPAFRYSLIAGDEALAANALENGIAHYNRALDAARLLGLESPAVDGELLRRLFSKRGRALELVQQFAEVQIHYQEMLALAKKRADPAMRLAALTNLCIVRATQTPLYNLAKAKEVGAEALTLARQTGDQATESRALWGLLLVEVWGEGNYQKGLELGLRSLKLAQEAGFKEQIGFTSQDLAHAYLGLHRLTDCIQANQDAIAIWRELGNIPMLVDALNQNSFLQFLLGDLAASIASSEEALKLSQAVDHAWSRVVALGFMINTLIEVGDWGQAAEMIEERSRLTITAGAGFHSTYRFLVHQHRISLALASGIWRNEDDLAAEIYENRKDLIPTFHHFLLDVAIELFAVQGNVEKAQEIWDGISPDWHPENASLFTAGLLTGSVVELKLAQKAHQPALEQTREIAARLRKLGCWVYLPEILWLQGRAEMGLEHWSSAQAVLNEALEASQRTGEKRYRWRILASLVKTTRAMGRQDVADQYQKMGRDVVSALADRIYDMDLRRTFLATE
jgi:DNA-binding SARP family transcriptional activator/tetratricopeptide (TPR) repeat protein